MPEPVIMLEQRVGRRLRERGLRLAVAESCTGGMLGERITAVPGSSTWFAGGVIAYANALKQGLLGVPRRLLDRDGAVSGTVARAMAEGVRRRTGTDLGAAITGVAGPGGGTPAKPVGTVWIAVAGPVGYKARRFRFQGGRSRIRWAATEAALKLVYAYAAAQ